MTNSGNLFVTVDKKGKPLATEGRYIIAKSKEDNTILLSETYSDGVAEDTGVFSNDNIIYVYPTGFLGASISKPNSKITVQTINSETSKKRGYIESRIPQN
jgi:hypothetical protein